ncbi:MAG: winged helix-turn-helix domain-containing protein [Nocardioidaceae bacterium]
MPLTRRRITSATDMKALAHPLRMDLLELLIVEGALTASAAARRLDQTPSNVSWHLRKLARHGFVRQADGGPGRERPWKAIAESLSWGEDAEDATAGEALNSVALERELQRLRAALAAQPTEPAAWRDAYSINQSRVWLTAAEAQDLARQLEAIFMSYADRIGDPSRRPAQARLMALMGWMVPTGPIPLDSAASGSTAKADTAEAARVETGG